MSKNLTRKGLALSAVVALGTSLFAGAPAQAAAAINVAPTVGTSYTVLGSDTFTVKAFGNADFSVVTGTLLRWKITKPTTTATVVLTDNASTTSVTRDVDGTNAAIEYVTPSSGAMTSDLGGNTLNLNPTTTAASDVVYKVQAYVESDGTTGLGSTELASAEQTITFSGTAVPTVTVDPVGVGVAAVANVTYTPAINYDQTLLANTLVVFTQNGTDRTVTATTGRVGTSPHSGIKLTTVSTTTPAGWTSVAAGMVVSAVAKAVRYDGDTTYATSASSSSSTGTADADLAKATVTKGANIALASSATTDYVVRKGTTSFTYEVAFTKATKAVAAGQPVTITASEVSGIAATDDIKVNGKAIKDDGSSTVINTVTDANGKVVISVTNALASSGDKFRIQVAQGSAAGTATDVSFEYANAALTALKEVAAPLVSDPSALTRTIVRNGTLSASYALVDQFGSKWTSANTATTYRLYANPGTVAGNATWGQQQINFVNGDAALTITDNSTSNAAYDVSVAVYRSQNGTGAWAAESGYTSVIKLNTVTSASTPSSISLGSAIQESTVVSDTKGVATNTANRTTATLARIDRRVDTNSASSLAILAAHSTTVTGVVKRADGGVAPGVAVTLTATGGVYFGDQADGEIYVNDGSISTVTDVNGVYTAYVFSATAGTKTITITSGAATATQKIKFAAAAANSGTAITITAPDYSAAGRSVDVSVLLADKFGAPVQSTSASPLRVTVTGAGSFTSIAADSDADGLVSFKLIFGANETGSAVIKATYDAANDGTVDLTVTKTVTIGTAPATDTATKAVIVGSTKRFIVAVSNNTLARNVVVKVAGKTFKTLKGSTATKKYYVAAPKGSHKVTVYVGGKLIATRTISVK